MQIRDILLPYLCVCGYTYGQIGVKYGGRGEWEKLKEFYKVTDDVADQQSALMALGRSMDPEILQEVNGYVDFWCGVLCLLCVSCVWLVSCEVLEWTRTSDDVRSQDKVYPFSAVSWNRTGRNIAWSHLQV